MKLTKEQVESSKRRLKWLAGNEKTPKQIAEDIIIIYADLEKAEAEAIRWKAGFEKMAELEDMETDERVRWQERAEKAEAELAELREKISVYFKCKGRFFEGKFKDEDEKALIKAEQALRAGGNDG